MNAEFRRSSMNNTQTKNMAIFLALAALMAVTRDHHFGSALHLPDATLAIFLLAGWYLARWAFPVLLAGAGLVDYLAINFGGVSDWCVSPAYWFLIPAYAVMWFGGRYLAARRDHHWHGLPRFAAVSFAACSLSFVISSGSFFLFSGRFGEMGVLEYAGSMTGYYGQYLAGTFLYLAIAACLQIAITVLSGRSSARA
jgi:hypothetical protein